MIRYEIPDKWNEEAAKGFSEDGLNGNTRAKKLEAHMAGNLGEFALGRAMQRKGIPFKHIDPLTTGIYGYDFLIHSKRIDVKTKYRNVDCKIDYTCDVPDYQKNICDYYVFASWNKKGNTIELVSAARQNEFKANAELIEAGQIYEGRKLKSPTYVSQHSTFQTIDDWLEAADLYSYRFTFGEVT